MEQNPETTDKYITQVNKLHSRLDNLIGEMELCKYSSIMPNYDVYPLYNQEELPITNIYRPREFPNVYVITDTYRMYPMDDKVPEFQDVYRFVGTSLEIKEREDNTDDVKRDYLRGFVEEDLEGEWAVVDGQALNDLLRRFEPQEIPKRIGAFEKIARKLGSIAYKTIFWGTQPNASDKD